MSKLEQVVGIVVVITLVVARFVLTANDSPDTIVVPASVSAPPAVGRLEESLVRSHGFDRAGNERVRFAIARS